MRQSLQTAEDKERWNRFLEAVSDGAFNEYFQDDIRRYFDQERKFGDSYRALFGENDSDFDPLNDYDLGDSEGIDI